MREGEEKLVQLGSRDREALAPWRAAHWRGPLREEEFAERNQRIYQHPFGQSSIWTYGLVAENQTVASLDALEVPLAVGDGCGLVRIEQAWHIASVLTLPHSRGKGWGSRLLRAFLAGQPGRFSTLFSGIDPAFYTRFGFVPSRAVEWRWAATSYEGAVRAVEKPLDRFVEVLTESRLCALRTAQAPASAFLTGELWWDWVAERYAYFAQLQGRQVSRGRFWQLETPEGPGFAAGLENWSTGTFDLWWWDTPPEGIHWIAGQALRLGLQAVVGWSAEGGWVPEGAELGTKTPMVRSPFEPTAPLQGAQLGDWW